MKTAIQVVLNFFARQTDQALQEFVLFDLLMLPGLFLLFDNTVLWKRYFGGLTILGVMGFGGLTHLELSRRLQGSREKERNILIQNDEYHRKDIER